MKYYTEISNIVRGALASDRKHVSLYIQQLIEKLKVDGEQLAVKGLSEQLEGGVQPVTAKGASANSISQRPVPVEKDNRFSLADITHPLITDSQIFLPDGSKKVIDSFLGYIYKKERLIELNIPINPTLLLHGMPGTGKSKLANHIAAKLDLPLVTARADALISSYLGSTSKNIRSLIDYAQSQPCVLFLDEFDAIAKARDDKNEIGELKRVVVSLLQNIDSLTDTIVIAATNHIHLLDPAIGRRFHYKLELTPPLEKERYAIFNSLLSKYDFTEGDLNLCVQVSDGMTGAEIEMATYEYLRYSIINELPASRIGLVRTILVSLYPWLNFESDEERSKNMHKLKEINGELFTGKLFSLLWDISPSYVSRLLKDNK
ncbi:AAA family ATPase [Marinobacterium mangrovicola]|uniref:ATPase family protein associated with various cellular activities (AAA) n=1 Tax=Marinobacterium mangrovicola TaxID=1476959 RepID=A0A4R1GS73_9GAMM|nr:ATP-binding protein [Marinobacterium mangrovicola]TCK09079.1 ATPase family protein associated with various cellular activities (AAA) [Marinobacterium mangrovicola]